MSDHWSVARSVVSGYALPRLRPHAAPRRPQFEQLAVHRCIVVTGPQRSGTTICAQMIAADTGHRYVAEEEFNVIDQAQWRDVCAQPNVVVQCPHFLKTIVDEQDPAKFVVLMRRPLAEIHASEDRIDWVGYNARIEYEPFLRHRGKWARRFLRRWWRLRGGPAALKYRYVRRHGPGYRGHFMDRHGGQWLDVEYGSLAGHPLWVPADERRAFTARQTARPPSAL